MEDQGQPHDDGTAEELLRAALLDDSSAVAVSLRVQGLPLSESMTVIFHGRRDLGTLQTYVARGRRGAGRSASRCASPPACGRCRRRPPCTPSSTARSTVTNTR